MNPVGTILLKRFPLNTTIQNTNKTIEKYG